MLVAAAALVGYGSFIVVSAVVGLRLLWLWRRTHGTPELAIAVALGAGGLAYALAIPAYSTPLPRTAAALVEMASGFFAHLGAASLALALRHIFQPASGWARALQISLTFGLAGAYALRLVDPLAFPPPAYVFWPYAGLAAISYGWAVVESLRAWRHARRHADAGLADPGIARRFLLWSVAGVSALGIFLAVMVDRLDGAGEMSPWTILLSSALGLTAAVGISFAFFPARPLRPTEVGAAG